MTADALAQLIVLTMKSALVPIRSTVAALDAHATGLTIRLAALEAQALELATLRERVAVLETRAPVPGPAGDPGRDGLDGRDGTDGIRVEDLTASYDDGLLTLGFTNGRTTKTIPVALPVPRWQGVWQDGRTYKHGECVTLRGCTWHCQQPTRSQPGDRASAWKLMVKSGRDYTPRPAGGA